MSVFNSLGSNYKIKHLGQFFAGFDVNAKTKLTDYLTERYSANVELSYKGRQALMLALKGLKLDKGAHVAINGYTCYAVYDAVVAAGFKPVYLDIAPSELNFSAAELSKQLKKDKKIRAVIVQNTLGTPADITTIEKCAREHKIEIIEDLAHCIGMKYQDGREAGVSYDAALSFSQDKVVDAVSGGALIYRDKKVEIKKTRLKYRRFLKDYYYIWNTLFIRSGYLWGGGKLYNYILRKLHWLPKPIEGDASKVIEPDNWHASLALKQYNDLEHAIIHRRRIAEIYRRNLPERIKFKHFDSSIYLRFPIKVENRESLIDHLKSKHIYVSDTWYDAPVSPRANLESTNYKEKSCPNAERVAESMVNLPTHINVEEDQAELITEEVNKWLSLQEK